MRVMIRACGHVWGADLMQNHLLRLGESRFMMNDTQTDMHTSLQNYLMDVNCAGYGQYHITYMRRVQNSATEMAPMQGQQANLVSSTMLYRTTRFNFRF